MKMLLKMLLVAVMMVTAASANAQAPATRAWISAGDTCEGGGKLEYQVGAPFKISVCAQWTGNACGFDVVLLPQVGSTGFVATERVLHPAFGDQIQDLPISGWPLSRPFNFGAVLTNVFSDQPYDGRPLVTITLIANDSALPREELVLTSTSLLSVPGTDLNHPSPTCGMAADSYFVPTPIYLDRAQAAAAVVTTPAPAPFVWPFPPAPANATTPAAPTTVPLPTKKAPQKRSNPIYAVQPVGKASAARE